MLKAKTKPTPEPSLAERIKATCAEATALVEAEARAEYDRTPGIPLTWFQANIRARHRSKCDCKVALALLKEQPNG
jgi:hypothetical protein